MIGGEGTQLQLTSPIFKSTAPARNKLGKIQNVGRCYSEGPGIQEFISSWENPAVWQWIQEFKNVDRCALSRQLPRNQEYSSKHMQNTCRYFCSGKITGIQELLPFIMFSSFNACGGDQIPGRTLNWFRCLAAAARNRNRGPYIRYHPSYHKPKPNLINYLVNYFN